jgi:hypothetical protein
MDIFTAFDNAFGGHDFTVGDHSYQTRENVFNGQDVYEHGQLVASTKSNVFGGVDMHDSHNQLVISTKNNVFGGQDIYSGNGGYEGYTSHDAMGTSYHDSSGALTTIPFEQGNAVTLLNYQDPLAHIGSYVLPTLTL